MTTSKLTLSDRLKVPAYDNPKEMRTGDLMFNPEICKECGICVQVCPAGSIRTDTTTKTDIVSGKATGGKYGIPRVERLKKGATLCVACYCCGAACPHGAISIKTNFNPGYRFKRLTQTTDMLFPKRY